MDYKYIPEKEIPELIGHLYAVGELGHPVGLDTEFSGVNIGKENVYARGTVEFISICTPKIPLILESRGHYSSETFVLSLRQYREDSDWESKFRSWLVRPYPKCVHNLAVDAHALANSGFPGLMGGINTLALSRWAWPERASRFDGAGFTLDALGRDFLGEGKTEDFTTLFSEEITETWESMAIKKVCACGAIPCHKRITAQGHHRIPIETRTPRSKKITRPIPLSSVSPGSSIWERALAYSARDAYLALGIYYIGIHTLKKQERPYPW